MRLSISQSKATELTSPQSTLPPAAARRVRDPHPRGARLSVRGRTQRPREHGSEGPPRAEQREHAGRTPTAPKPGEHPYEREVTQTGATEHRYRVYSPFGPIGEIVRNDAGSELSRTYWHKDLPGSPEVLTNASGSVLHRQKFSAFGQSDSPTWQSSNAAVRRVRRGYTGHEHDPETGLVNMGARLYDARTARFMAPDLGVQVPSWTQSWNRFSYAWNSPMNWVDPTGLENSAPGDVPLTGAPTINGEPAPLGLTIQIPVSEIPGLTGTGVAPIETPAPLTAPGATGVSPDVRTPAEAPGAGANEEFGPPAPGDFASEALEYLTETPLISISPVPTPVPLPPYSIREIAEGNRDTPCALLGCGVANAVTSGGHGEAGPSEGRKIVVQVLTVIAIATGGRLGAPTKAVNLPAWNKITVNLQHILQRHVPGAVHSAGRTVFPSTMSPQGITRAIQQAYQSGTKVGVQGPTA
jgi:RHS repeat-associated protein